MNPASQSKQIPATLDARPQVRLEQGARYWFHITGLPGWKRAQLGIPAFGTANCVPHRGEKHRKGTSMEENPKCRQGSGQA